MGSIIEEINAANVNDFDQCDGGFIIDTKTGINVEEDEIRYGVAEIPKLRKRNEFKGIKLPVYINDPNKTLGRYQRNVIFVVD